MIKVEFELPEHSISKELSTEEYGFETEADVCKIIEHLLIRIGFKLNETKEQFKIRSQGQIQQIKTITGIVKRNKKWEYFKLKIIGGQNVS